MPCWARFGQVRYDGQTLRIRVVYTGDQMAWNRNATYAYYVGVNDLEATQVMPSDGLRWPPMPSEPSDALRCLPMPSDALRCPPMASDGL